jgi:hypothetical protein
MNLVFERKKEEIINIKKNPLDEVEWNPCEVLVMNLGGKKSTHEYMSVEGVGYVCRIFDENHNLIQTHIDKLLKE